MQAIHHLLSQYLRTLRILGIMLGRRTGEYGGPWVRPLEEKPRLQMIDPEHERQNFSA